jgi:hypothetical protein
VVCVCVVECVGICCAAGVVYMGSVMCGVSVCPRSSR